MCVTNTTNRRLNAVSFTPAQVGVCPSVLSQRLLGVFPTQQHAVGLTSTIPTADYMKPAADEKTKPKRRRKPQKPGKTAKLNDRHFVVHNYHDHANDPDENDVDDGDASNRRGGVSVAFPMKLHSVLEQVEADGLAHVVSWMPHGRCFVVHKPKEFVDHVMPK